jgi:hypothetical protein
MPPPAPRFEAAGPHEEAADRATSPPPRSEASRPAEAAAPRDAEVETRWQRGPDADGAEQPEGRSGPHSTRGSRERKDASDKRERRDDAASSTRELPGEPANRVYRPNSKWEAKQQQRVNEANSESR